MEITSETSLDSRFQKVLVARYSPKNSCYAEDGTLLYAPQPSAEKLIKHGTSLNFLSIRDHKTPSRFGWVKSVDEFSLDEFVRQYLPGGVTVEHLKVLADMFKAISKLPDGTPVAATYFRRGVENRRPELSFHRVFFYKG